MLTNQTPQSDRIRLARSLDRLYTPLCSKEIREAERATRLYTEITGKRIKSEDEREYKRHITSGRTPLAADRSRPRTSSPVEIKRSLQTIVIR
ncbi:MAG: hypothetical protein WKF84_21000 [Pyrinomonadaceae bacterium]